VTLLTQSQYSSDPYTRNYGSDKIRESLAAQYGQRYFDYRADWERAGPGWLPPFPVNLVFDLVDKCNLACPQCLRAPDLIKDYDGFIGTQKYLPYDVIARILDESKSYALPSVNIGGSGECTLHPDFIKICEKVMEIDVCEFRIITNGLRLKGDISASLIDLGVHMVSVSIDGFSAETFHKTRGKAHRYQDVVDNVVAFAEEKRRRGARWPLLRVSFVEQECNRHETQDFVRFWSDYADMIDVQVYHDFRMTAGFDDKFDCFEPFKRLTIWAYGGAGPCCGFPGIVYNVGDFEKRSIKDIWDGSEMTKIRAMSESKVWQLPCLQCQGTRTVF
jgi:MoaA/NifB/PqqE/SkfB family radical SAM enzyme